MNMILLLLLNLALVVRHVRSIETVYDAATIARGLVDQSVNSVATMGTVFSPNHPTLAGQPFVLQEYYANCHRNGSLTLLFLPISRHSRNIMNTAGHTASFSFTSNFPAARNARVSLMGNVTIFKEARNVPNLPSIRRCYLEKHPDARWWLPEDENAAHTSYWARFDPQSVYFVGGFGNDHYIGPIPLHIYQDAGMKNYEPILGIAGRIIVEQH
ncbi:hypothetical protein AX15_003686 [Amanita polypyramis BW_CC]|nr:hypothetical protein AX15_003686 [Amanita polypyramis BW_CC]